MLKYIFTLATLLDSKSRIKKHYSPDTVISDLLDEDLDAGAYRKVFDASSLSSGTYMYSLTSNGSTITKKMLLMK